jgi:hypothetical protein
LVVLTASTSRRSSPTSGRADRGHSGGNG